MEISFPTARRSIPWPRPKIRPIVTLPLSLPAQSPPLQLDHKGLTLLKQFIWREPFSEVLEIIPERSGKSKDNIAEENEKDLYVDNEVVSRYYLNNDKIKKVLMLKRVFLLFLAFSAFVSILSAQGNFIYLIKIDGIINPATAGFVLEGIERAEQDGASCLVIQMDTPGGLMESMRSIVKRILGSKVPIIVYVAPSGSRAGSAGVFITLAAHIAAMAPGTNIGAAHPVQMGEKKMSKEMEAKILNDTVAYIKTIAKQRGRNAKWAEKAVRKSVSVTEKQALRLGVIDLISPTLEDLLNKVDGKRVKVAPAKVITLKVKGLEIRTLEMSFRDRLLNTISNPNIAYILLMLGIYGLFFEIANPGVILPGIIGGI